MLSVASQVVLKKIKHSNQILFFICSKFSAGLLKVALTVFSHGCGLRKSCRLCFSFRLFLKISFVKPISLMNFMYSTVLYFLKPKGVHGWLGVVLKTLFDCIRGHLALDGDVKII